MNKFISIQKQSEEEIIFSLGIGWLSEYIREDVDGTVYESRLVIGGMMGVYSIEIILYKKLTKRKYV